MDFIAFYASIATVAVVFALHVFRTTEIKDAEGMPVELVGAEAPTFWERVTLHDLDSSWVRKFCLRLCERCSPAYKRLDESSAGAAPDADSAPLNNVELLLAPNVWNLLPIASCLWNDVILFWYLPLSIDIDWSPFFFELPFRIPHIFYQLRDLAAWAVLELAALRPVLPMPET
eukprot:6939013-Prymnesium_polylepis.1